MPHHCILNGLKRVDVIKLPATVTHEREPNPQGAILVLNQSQEVVSVYLEVLLGEFGPFGHQLGANKKLSSPNFTVLAAWHVSGQEDTCPFPRPKACSIFLRVPFAVHPFLPWSASVDTHIAD